MLRSVLVLVSTIPVLFVAARALAIDCATITGNAVTSCGFEDAGEVASWSPNGGTASFGAGQGETGGGALGQPQNFGGTWVFGMNSPCFTVSPGEDFSLGYAVRLTGGTAPSCSAGYQQWSDAACSSPNGGSIGFSPQSPGSAFVEVTDSRLVGSGTGSMQLSIDCRGSASFAVVVDNAYATTTLPAPELTSARIEPLVIRPGIETLEMTVTTSSPAVTRVTIDTGSLLTVGGAPTTSIVLVDDGIGADDVAGDGIFTAGGIGFQSTPSQLGGGLLRTRNIDYLFADASTSSSVEDLGLTLRYMDPSVPIPFVNDMAPDARATSHVVALERPLLGTFPNHFISTSAVAQRYYDLFPDDRDWLMLAYPFNTAGPAGSHFAVRNDVQGIGRAIFDNSGTYGSASVLRGILQLYYLTAANHVTVNHEILHQWAVFLDARLDLGDGTAHWGVVARPSSAFGIGTFTDIDFISGNTYWGLNFGAFDSSYNDLELYLMGLAGIDEVASPIQTLEDPVFQSHGSIFCDPRGCATPFIYDADSLREVTTTEILAAEGARVPSSVNSPKVFRSAMIVVYDRPLTNVELAYYEYAASEYEKNTSSIGMSFAEATGERASIETVIPEPSRSPLLASGVLWMARVARRRKRA